LRRIKKIGVTKEELLNILNQNESMLDLLADVKASELKEYIKIIQMYSLTDYDVSEIIMVLKNAKYFFETLKILTNKKLIEAGIVLEGADLINESKEYFNAKYASQVLTSKTAIEAGIVLEGADLINE